MAQISPDGSWLALRKWHEQPWTDEFMTSNLIITNLSNGEEKFLGDAMIFKWSPDGNHLAYLAISPTGLGQLSIFSLAKGSTYSFPGEYDVIDYNWAGENLMIQADYNDQVRLVHLVPTDWQVKQDFKWDLNSAVNQNYAWISINKNRLRINIHQHQPREFTFDNEIVSFTDWSPNGRLAVIEDESGKSWIYDHQSGQLTAIKTPGSFAAWGDAQQLYWYLPVWEKLHVLVRLDSNGGIREYLPYNFTVPHYDLSISSNGRTVVLVEGSQIYISRK